MDRQFRKRRESRWLILGILLSFALHGLLFYGLMSVEPAPQAKKDREIVRLKVLDKAQEAQSHREAKEAQEAQAAVIGGQIVDIPAPAVEEIPDDARYLSRYNTKVEKEQKSRHRGRPTGDGGQGGPPPGGPLAQGTDSADQRAKQPGEELPVMLPGPESDVPAGTQSPGSGKSQIGLAALGRMMSPSLGSGRGMGGRLGRGTGLGGAPGGSDDALLGIEDEGETTLVNSRSFRYWDFFQRVKDGVRGTWDPGTLYSARDPSGKTYGNQDRLTVVSVILDGQGNITRLEVVKESGLPFLDQEALRAFRQAGPFRNPPVGLVDDSGKIAFNFGFLLEVGSSRGRFFWRQP